MAVLFFALPVKLGSYTDENAIAEALTQNGSEPTVVGEAEWLREKNSETYMLSDGGYECVVYSEDKYFEDETGYSFDYTSAGKYYAILYTEYLDWPEG